MRRLIPVLTGLFLLTCALHAQNSSSFEVWRADPLFKLSDNTTDSVSAVFDTIAGKVRVTIRCEIRTAFGSRTTRRLQLQIQDFTGVKQYTPLTGPGQNYWENFSRDSTCNCADNSVNKIVITKWNAADKQLEGTFEFRCHSFDATSGETLPYRVRAGSFRWGGKDKIVIKTDPKDTLKIGALQADTTFNIIVEAEEKSTLLAGATIKVFDKTKTGSTVFVNAGTTDGTGKLSYPVTLQKDAPAGDYEIKFYGTKTDHDSSDTVTVLIRYRNRFWDFKCLGLPILTFDAGEGKEWKPISDGSPIVSSSGVIKIEEVIEVRGKVRINTTEGAEKVFIDSGNVVFPTTDDDGGPFAMAFDFLFDEDDKSMALPDCNGLINLMRDSVVKKLSKKLPGGIEVSIEKFTFINRPTGKGIDIEGKVKLGPGSRLGCDPVQDPDGAMDGESPSRAITVGLALTTAGFDNLRVKVENISATDYICIKEISASIDNFNKTCGMAAKASFPVKGTQLTAGFSSFFKSGTGSFGVSDMMLDSISAEVELDECKLIPETPFCFKGLKFSGSGLSNRTTGAGITLRAGVVINSFEQAILDKAPWLRNLTDTLAIAQIEGTLQYTHPLIFTGIVTARLLRIDKPFKTKPWQGEGSYSLSVDFNSGITANATANFGHLGGDDYFVSGQITERLYWNPMLGISGSASGTVRIPNPGSDLLEVPGIGTVLRFMKLSGWIPQTLGSASMTTFLNQDDGFLLKGSIDVSQNPITYIRDFGIMSAAVSCKNGNWDVNLQQGMTATSFQRKKGEEVDAYPAQALDTIAVDASMTRVFVMINSTSTAPVSTIVKPDGTEFTTSSSDSTIKRFSTPNGEMVQWTLISPVVGNWILKLASPKAGDEVEVMANRVQRAFEISSSQSDSTVTVTWPTSDAPANSEVRVYIDAVKGGFAGAYLGKSTEQSGQYTFTLPSSMSECTYYVYATRFAPGETDQTAGSPNSISNPKSAVPVPINVQASATQLGHVTLTWRVPPGSTVAGFLISVIDAQGVETPLTTASTDERTLEFDLTNHESKRIVVRAYDAIGQRSCGSTATSITTDVDEDYTYSETVAGNVLIVPNPMHDVATIQYELHDCAAESIVIYDVIGHVVDVIAVPADQSATGRVIWQPTAATTGTYFVKIRCRAGEVVGMISLTR